jgi:predicted ester cyclase
MSERNKQIVRRVLEEFWHRGEERVLDEVFSTDYVNHELSNPEVRGLEEYKQWARGVRGMFNTGLSNWQITAEDLIAEGDKVVKRFVLRGTHTGELLGVSATGRTVGMRGMSLYLITNGKVREIYWNFDLFGLAQQIGALPAAGATAE